MSGAEIALEGVWKKFRRGERFDSLRDLLPAMARGVFRGGRQELDREEFWALEDVSFHVGPGEALGIIGPNGAGKTTVLRVLTRLLRPTRGRCHVYGRIGALIDVSGGFHADLTGRENVFLRGAIVGMSRREIVRCFDSIVEFARLASFIDTPVKRYSSGMSARLGFSIAAHLDPEVLLIDEVLAVGDASFQKKAYDRIREMVRGGVPTIVISHQLERVAALCTQGILLVAGRVAHRGPPTDCITAYMQSDSLRSASQPSSTVHIDSVTVQSDDLIRSGGNVALLIRGRVPESETGDRRIVGVRVRDLGRGEVVFATGTLTHGVPLPEGRFALGVELQMNVAPGVYAVETYTLHRDHDRDVLDGPSTTVRVEESTSFWGHVQLNARMRLERDNGTS
jgi:lipopolysaccharide transport system ATP-binding protein